MSQEKIHEPAQSNLTNVIAVVPCRNTIRITENISKELYLYHPRMQFGNNFSRVSVYMCMSLCSYLSKL